MDLGANVSEWVSWAEKLMKPKNVVWATRDKLDALREEALATGELLRLDQELLPGCYLHRSKPNDVARTEDRTFICTSKEEDAGPSNNWRPPQEMYDKLGRIFDGSMAGRTMYVIPFCMGAVGSPFSKLGIEITDSIYVVLSMHIMTRCGPDALEMFGSAAGGDFVKCLHSTATLSAEDRYICHFPEDNAIWSVNSGYGGNALLGKKCFALRIASYLARNEGWLAEHMLIIGIENPDGEVRYVSAAFPSACGKTNLAMLIPPEGYRNKGYKVWCVGDDIAWLRIGADGRLYATNPENGYFGVVPGTNTLTNPNALATISRDTIYTNVAYDAKSGAVWWEGLNDSPPQDGIDWKGEPWNGRLSKEKGAHPNSRFTAPASNCPVLSPEVDNPDGVPISAIIFGGRRAKTAPLVYQARDWAHGVFVASTMASETTAAQSGAVGVTRIDSMAMKPFCGYNMGDYFAHWLKMGERLGDKAPKVFNVNWFRTDADGKFMWPGYGENFRVLEWILERARGGGHAQESPIGLMPRPEDINTEGLLTSPAAMSELFAIDLSLWKTEAESIRRYYETFGDRLPAELRDELAKLDARLAEAAG